MFGAAIVFVIVACFYKGRTYLQSQLTPDEIATEPILHGGTPSYQMKIIVACVRFVVVDLAANANPRTTNSKRSRKITARIISLRIRNFSTELVIIALTIV